MPACSQAAAPSLLHFGTVHEAPPMLTYPALNAACRCDTAAQQDVDRDRSRFEAEAGDGGCCWLRSGEFGPCPLWGGSCDGLGSPRKPLALHTLQLPAPGLRCHAN